MSDYTAPLADMRFVLDKIIGREELAALEGLEAAAPDTVDAVLSEASRLAGEVLATLNQIGDEQRCVIDGAEVTTPDGFKEAYDRFVEGGWNGIMFDPEIGGQGLPKEVE